MRIESADGAETVCAGMLTLCISLFPAEYPTKPDASTSTVAITLRNIFVLIRVVLFSLAKNSIIVYMAKIFALILGVILALLGLLGFISNPFIGMNAVFVAGVAQNLIHIMLGAILLIIAFWFSKNCVQWLKIIGAVTFLFGLIGILTIPSTGGALLGVVTTNGASNWLNLIAGIVLFIAGIYGKDSVAGVIA